MNDPLTSAQNSDETSSQNSTETHTENASTSSNPIEISNHLFTTNLIPSVGSAWVAQFMNTVANNSAIQSAQENGNDDNNSDETNFDANDGSNQSTTGFLGNGLHPSLTSENNNEEFLDVTTNTTDTSGEIVQNGVRTSSESNSYSVFTNGNTGSRSNSQEDDEQPPKLDISTVGSPIVFGANGHGNGSPHVEDERVIERCDVLQNPVSATTWPQPDQKRDQLLDGIEAPSTSASTPSAQVPPAPPVSLPIPPSSIPSSPSFLTAINSVFDFVRNAPPSISSNSEQFAQAMCQWRWYTIDEVKLPIVLRDESKLIAVQLTHMKLLSKFPAHIPPEIQKRYVMVSTKITPTEAWILNIVNATVSNFDLGCYVFTTNDEMVDITAVERYYWVVKKYHLQNLRNFYECEIHNVKPDNWTLKAALLNLRGLQGNIRCDAESRRLEADAQASIKSETPTNMNFQRRVSQPVSQ